MIVKELITNSALQKAGNEGGGMSNYTRRSYLKWTFLSEKWNHHVTGCLIFGCYQQFMGGKTFGCNKYYKLQPVDKQENQPNRSYQKFFFLGSQICIGSKRKQSETLEYLFSTFLPLAFSIVH